MQELINKRNQLPFGEGYKIIDEQIENKILTLGKGKFLDKMIDATLINCSIIFEGSGRSVILKNVKFQNCTIKVKRPLTNFQFLGCYFNECIFEGKYIGCRFGNFQNNGGELIKCDFSNAKLHLCDFHGNCDLNTFLWPQWPYVTFVEPEKHKEEWLSIKLFPKRFQITQKSITEGEKTKSAVTVDTSEYENEQIMWALLQDLDFIVFHNKSSKKRIEEEKLHEIKNHLLNEEIQRNQENELKAKYEIWYKFSHLGTIEQMLKMDNNFKIYINTSTLTKKIVTAPKGFEIYLFNVKKASILLDEQEKDLSHWNEKFRIMSVKISPDEVILVGHKKTLGRIYFTYEKFVVKSEEGIEYGIGELEKLSKQYWDLPEGFY